MLEIKPIQTKEEQKEICGVCGVEFSPDCLAYGAKENGVFDFDRTSFVAGVSQFRILGKYAVIYDLANAVGIDDLEVLILMGKAMLNFVDLCGVKDVIIKTENIQNKNLIKILGFKEDNSGVYKLNLKDYFDSPCQKD